VDVLALQIRFTQADMAEVVRRLDQAVDHSLEDVRVELANEGIKLSGIYPMFLRVKFETTWTPSVRDGKLHVRLADLRALGVPGTIFRSAVVKLIEDAIENEPGVTRVEESIVFDLERVAAARLFPVSIQLQDVRIEQNALILTAGREKMEA
jgi:hypothetical protein